MDCLYKKKGVTILFVPYSGKSAHRIHMFGAAF